MRSPETQRRFPLYPLLGAGSLILISLLSVAWIQWFAGQDTAAAPVDPLLMARELRFEDRADGSVEVSDADTGQHIRRIKAGEDGFVRATLRGLVRARRARGAGQTVPFRLELRASGQLLLLDPATDQSIDLWAFGATNAEAFASLLDPKQRPFASAALAADFAEPQPNGSNEHAR